MLILAPKIAQKAFTRRPCTQEADRVGALRLDRCEALGVRPGRAYSQLKEGESVEALDGSVITPEMVLTPTRPGRRIAVLGTSCNGLSTPALQRVAAGADLLILGALATTGSATSPPLKGNGAGASSTGVPAPPSMLPCTAAEAGRVAESLGARHVLLSRFDSRRHNPTLPPRLDPIVSELVSELAAEFVSGDVSAVNDLWTHVMDKHEGPMQPPARPRVVWTPYGQQEAAPDVPLPAGVEPVI